MSGGEIIRDIRGMEPERIEWFAFVVKFYCAMICIGEIYTNYVFVELM